MKKLLFAFAAVAFVSLSSCKSNNKKEAAEKDSYEKTKETLEEKERKNPLKFLTVTSKDKHNLLGQTVIKGSIHNNAKICVYKDVELSLSFYSKTGVLLEKDSEKVYETIEPGKEAAFKTKYFAPKGTDSVAISIINAKAQ